MTLGKLIREKRQQLGWTQGVAAQNIGIKQSYLSKLENDQFLPSDDVFKQIQQQYNLTSAETSLYKNENIKVPLRKGIVYSMIVFCFAISLIIIGQQGMLFGQTYYTYKATLIGEPQNTKNVLSYELTDKYRGEIYRMKFAGHQYEYHLLGTREISRNENNWLTLIGILLALVSAISGFLLRGNRNN